MRKYFLIAASGLLTIACLPASWLDLGTIGFTVAFSGFLGLMVCLETDAPREYALIESGPCEHTLLGRVSLKGYRSRFQSVAGSDPGMITRFATLPEANDFLARKMRKKDCFIGIL